MSGPLRDSGQMMRSINNNSGVAAAGSGVIGLALLHFTIQLSIIALRIVTIGIFSLFAEAKRPFEFIVIVGTILLSGIFLHGYFHWFDFGYPTPAAVFLLALIILVSACVAKEISLLSETRDVYVEEMNKTIGVLFFVAGIAIWSLFHYEQSIKGLYISYGLNKGDAMMATNATIFGLIYLLLVVSPRYAIALIAERKVEASILEYLESLNGSEEQIKEVLTMKKSMMNEISNINKYARMGFSGHVPALAVTAAYVGVIWYFSNFSISNYNLSLF